MEILCKLVKSKPLISFLVVLVLLLAIDVQQPDGGKIRSFVTRPFFNSSGLPPEAFMSTPELIRHHGYNVEEHKVETADGYIITIFRIVILRENQKKPLKKKEPVLLMHGLYCSSDDWLLLNSPKHILPYLLAEDGHDVWLGNLRGNTYSLENSNGILANDSKFYDFTMDDAGRDIGAMIPFILSKSGSPQLSYVCHSMGCNLVAMAIHEKPELGKVVKKMSFLAPGIYAEHTQNPTILALDVVPPSTFMTFSSKFLGGRVLAEAASNVLKTSGPSMCNSDLMLSLCFRFLGHLAGFPQNQTQISKTTLVKVFGHISSHTSAKLLIHYWQLVKSKRFQKYDFGPAENLQIYGASSPPTYDLARISVPIQGIYGAADILENPKDAVRTFQELPNMKQTILVNDPEFSHVDFLYSDKAPTLVYNHVVKFLSS